MSEAVAALQALLEELTRHGSVLADHLEPGLPRDQVRALIRQAGARPHADVIELYAWHNGFDRFRVPVGPNGIASLVPSHQEFNPLGETLDVYVQRRSIAEGIGATPMRTRGGGWETIDPDTVWSRDWFPIFEGPGSEVIFIDNSTDAAGSVWLHPVQDSPRRLFSNLADAMNAVRLALVEGRLELDAAGAFTYDSSRAAGLEI